MKFQYVAAASILFCAQSSALAGNATLGFSSLPSAQGWTFFTDSAVPEGTVFSVSGGTLFMDSTTVNGAYYKLDGLVDPSMSFELLARARAVTGGTALAFYVEGGGHLATFHLAPSSITVLSGGNYISIGTFDNTSFHNYRLAGDFGGTYTLAIDGVTVRTAAMEPGGGNTVILGDGGGLGGGTAELTSFDFRQPIPEPSSALLLLLGLLLGAGSLARERGDA